MNQQSKNNYDMYTINGKSYLTKKGWEVYNKDSMRWDIIRVYCWMHQFQPEARALDSGDYFCGPKFFGSIDNIFKLTISKDYQCIFQQVETNEENLKKIRKHVKLNDFTWFETNTSMHIQMQICTNMSLFLYLFYI